MTIQPRSPIQSIQIPQDSLASQDERALEQYANLPEGFPLPSTHAYRRGDKVTIFSVEGPDKLPIIEGQARIIRPALGNPVLYEVRFAGSSEVVKRPVFAGHCQTNPNLFLATLILQWKERLPSTLSDKLAIQIPHTYCGPNVESGEMNSDKTPTPGPASGTLNIRPTRAEAEENEDAFYRLLDIVRKPETQEKSLPLKQIADRLGIDGGPTEVATLMFRRIQRRTLPEDGKRYLLRHIFEEENLLLGKTRNELNKIDDAFYFAFLNFFNTRETSQDNARAAVVGTYKLWRFSVEHENEFVFGKLEFSEDPKTRALRATMTQPKLATDGTRETIEKFSGYFFRVANMYLMILRDLVNNDIRVTLFPRFKLGEVGTDINKKSIYSGRHNHIVHMDGFGLGIDGAQVFFSPVHLALVDDVDELAQLDRQLDVVPDGDPRIPARVVKKLTRNGPFKRL